jgi:hypothetical protein
MGTQSGYGFIHYSLTHDGVSSVSQAVDAMNGITFDFVSYECTIAHGLRNYLLNNFKSFPRLTLNHNFFGRGGATSAASPRQPQADYAHHHPQTTALTPTGTASNPSTSHPLPRNYPYRSDRSFSVDFPYGRDSPHDVRALVTRSFAVNRFSSAAIVGKSSNKDFHFPSQQRYWTPSTAFLGSAGSNDDCLNF